MNYQYGASARRAIPDREMVDTFLSEARRLEADPLALEKIHALLEMDLREGASVAARYYGETFYCNEDSFELRRFFFQGVVDRAFGVSTDGVFSAPVLWPPAAPEGAGDGIERAGATAEESKASRRARDKEKRERVKAANEAIKADQAAEKAKEKERIAAAMRAAEKLPDSTYD